MSYKHDVKCEACGKGYDLIQAEVGHRTLANTLTGIKGVNNPWLKCPHCGHIEDGNEVFAGDPEKPWTIQRVLAEVASLIEEESELDGPIPEAVWNTCQCREGAALAMRGVVRATKKSLLAKLDALKAKIT